MLNVLLNICNLAVSASEVAYLSPAHSEKLGVVGDHISWVFGNALESRPLKTPVALAESLHPPEYQISSYNKKLDQLNSMSHFLLRTRVL